MSELALRYAATISLGAVIILGILKLLTPFCGDTANFHLAARMLDEGRVLYRDFWDMKQPGIYWFFLAARKLFGGDQLAPRLLELIVLLLFSLVLIATLAGYYGSRWLAAVVPVAGIGSYYAAASDWHLTQAEFMVSFPIFVSAWCLAKDYRTRGGRFLGLTSSGILAGVAVIFKLVFAPIFVAFILVSVLEHSPGRDLRNLIIILFRELFPFTVGVVSVLAIVSLIFAINGAFKELVWTAFVYPAEAYNTELAPLARLASAVTWYSLAMMPWIIFACFTVPRLFRRGEPLLTKLMAVWVIAGLAVIIVQRFSWWQYHFLLLFVPVAVLGVRGIEVLLDRLRRTGHVEHDLLTALSLALVLAAFANTVQLSAKTWEALVRSFGDEGGGIEAYRRAVGKDYARIGREVAQVRDDRYPGPIYVFGNPLYYLFFDRPQAIVTQSWGWQNATQEQWRNLAPALVAAKPPFIYVSSPYSRLVERESPETKEFLEKDYGVVRQDGYGTWYLRSHPDDLPLR